MWVCKFVCVVTFLHFYVIILCVPTALEEIYNLNNAVYAFKQ